MLILAACMLTAYKTIIYFGIELMSGFANTGHNDAMTLTTMFVLPNVVWVIVPGVIVWYLASKFIQCSQQSSSKSKRK